jgi:hypothetical protein
LNSYGHQDFAEHFAQINQICDGRGCNSILYSLFTWDENSPLPRTYQAIFDGLKDVQCVILEVGSRKSARKVVEVWLRDEERPLLFEQSFAKSSEPHELKRNLIREIHKRIIGNGIIVICGESNIANFIPQNGTFRDDFGFNSILRSHDVKVMFNPLHDYMTRYEMKRKRSYYSTDQRYVITVWNQGKRKGESHFPWTVFCNGEDLTDKVQEVSHSISERRDIRIGIVPDIL